MIGYNGNNQQNKVLRWTCAAYIGRKSHCNEISSQIKAPLKYFASIEIIVENLCETWYTKDSVGNAAVR